MYFVRLVKKNLGMNWSGYEMTMSLSIHRVIVPQGMNDNSSYKLDMIVHRYCMHDNDFKINPFSGS
jgi:hypothetical protein